MKNRLAKLLHKSAGAADHMFWISFAEPEPPKGRGFLGVIITRAESFEMALLKITVHRMNPGGQAAARVIPLEFEANNAGYEDRLLSKADLLASGLLRQQGPGDKKVRPN